MGRSNLQPLVDEWSPLLRWTPAQGERALAHLTAISRANGGDIVQDMALDKSVAGHHARARAMAPLDRYVRRVAQRLAEARRRPRYREVRDDYEQENGLGLIGMTWETATDINTATSDRLAALPAIGTVLAERIVQRRNQLGRLAGPEDLDAVEGIGPGALEALERRVFYGAAPAAPLDSGPLRAFLATPTFDRYVALAASTGGGFSWESGAVRDPGAHVLDILKEVAVEARVDPYAPHSTPPSTRASRVAAEQSLRDEAAKIAGESADDVVAATLLRNRDYALLVERLLATATRSIDLAMFFMRFVATNAYPTDKVIAELVAAHERGTAVRVILDRDQKGDPFHSRQINQAAFDRLTTAGIPVRFDREDRLMHAKVLVADGKMTVIGSHNWTAGSFRRYDDTSVFLESAALAARYTRWFDDLWNSLA